jgi:hypothetical protein
MNIWKAERLLLDYPHCRIRSSRARIARLRARYRRFRARHGMKPIYYEGRERWTPIPEEFRSAEGLDV